MRKILKQFVICMVLMSLSLALFSNLTYAAVGGGNDPNAESSSITSQIKESGEGTNLPSFEIRTHPEAPASYVLEGAGTAISPVYYIVDLIRIVTSSIAVLMVIVMSLKLISVASEEEATLAKKNIMYGIIGLITINLATVLVKDVFFGEYGEIFEDEVQVELFAESANQQIRGIIGFINAFVAATAVLVLVIRGVVLLTSFGEEEAISSAKKHVVWAGIGLVLAGVSELVVKGIIFPDSGKKMPSLEEAYGLLASLTNYAASFVVIFCFLALLYAGYKYVASAGNEEETENVKKIFIGVLIALALALGAFALTNTLVKFETPKDTREEQLPVSE
ncbi:pilin [Patescibacteria group bacterium]|nr:pilin [Patescibacteria group bacterium]